MGVPESGLEAAGRPTADTLLTAFRTIKDAERAAHASVLDYWLSIRGDKEFPPLRDLDPLEISDAGPCSILFELIGGGQDAEIRHLGDGLAGQVTVQRLIDAPNPSLLSTIARKLPIVAISREFLAFEDNFTTSAGLVRCWVTLLPLSSCGAWVDYVYAFVSLETSSAGAAPVAQSVAESTAPAPREEPVAAQPTDSGAVQPVAEDEAPAGEAEAQPVDETAADAAASEQAGADEPAEQQAPAIAAETPATDSDGSARLDPAQQAELPAMDGTAAPTDLAEVGPDDDRPEPPPAAETEVSERQEEGEADSAATEALDAAPARSGPGFSRLIEGIANLTGFYGQGVKPDAEVRVDVPAIDAAPGEAAAAAHPPAPDDLTDVAAARDAGLAAEPQAGAVETSMSDAAAYPAQLEDAVSPPIETVTPEHKPAPAMEGYLQNKLTEVRAKADEAREAQRRAVAALHEGLSAAYDFALDAEASPEEYLRMVEAQGMKIQLRSPMAPVARLAFDGVCDAATIKQFEAALAWALKEELPRGALLERIESAGGIEELLRAAH